MQMAQPRNPAAPRSGGFCGDGDSRGGRMALNSFGKWVYGAVFVVVLPIALTAWAMATRDTVGLPTVISLPFGVAAASIGTLVLLLGMAHLWIYGGGLPMNA